MHHATLETLLSALTAAQPFQFVLENGDASVVVYAPHDVDRQYAHDRAEVYVVARGHGQFLNGRQSTEFSSGDLLFVDVAVQHRFVKFSPDLAVWAVFFGPSILGRHRFAAGTASPDSSGELLIEQKQGSAATRGEDVFRATWNTAGGPTLNGLGFGRNGHISFARADAGQSDQVGLVEYGLAGGHLRARWAHPAFVGMIGFGDGVRQSGSANGFLGRYSIQYTDDSGKPIFDPFILDIVAEGSTLRLAWDAPNSKLAGIGVETDGMLVAAWGPPSIAAGLVDYNSPVPGLPRLTGRTVQTGATEVGLENVSLAAASS